jgi:glycosyltransferase involved in cell wall biosynthesis
MPKLSVILITLNESAHILDCLESVRFADEWIVVDAGSHDDTAKRAQEWGATVYIHSDWQGFGIQKNRALNYATGEWILSIDADERVTPELAAEIQQTILHPSSIQGYTIPRLSSYCGHFMRHGGWWPDRVLRLFRKASGQFSNRKVHESVQLNGSIGELNAHFIHYTYASIDAWMTKMNAYSTAGAIVMLEQGKKSNVTTAILKGFWAFLRAYIFRAGFLDGSYGLIAAISAGESTYYRCIKRWLMDQKK